MQIRKRIILILTVFFLSLPSMKAQNVADLILSEAALDGDEEGIVDGYGRHSGWIEIFNNSQGTVSYGGCFLSDDRNNLKKNVISKSDLKTKLGPRQTVLFYATGKGEKGTFYVNFKITPGTTLYLTSNDGRTIIDSLRIPATLPVGKSVSKTATDSKQMDFQTLDRFTLPTPGVPNGLENLESNSQKMERQDPFGIILSIVSISVVFASLIILWILFSTLFKDAKASKTSKKKKAGGKMTPEVAAAISLALDQEMNGEIYAAIGMALHQYQDETVHDEESFILTIRPSQNGNWNDKTQNFRKSPK